MKKPDTFKKKIIASAIASVAFAGLSGVAIAQETEAGSVEEVIVTGIRGSLKASMDIKRSAAGVVDAISAEDIGKMPDTNLAESLQRITGVSIDRAGGEGSKVTVRGFGADYNLVTLNGRAMPSSGFDSRSFEFADLASESVSGLEVYKTGRASVASGGIGATINIKTLRPLDSPGLKFSVGSKAVHDTTVINGDELTPEISGLFSTTFADDMFGIAVTGSYQERAQGNVGAYSQQWNTKRWDPAAGNANITSRADAVIINQHKGALVNSNDNLYSTPIDFRLTLGEQERERTNGQLTFQFAPTDRLKTTLDYTYSELQWHEERIEQSLWFVGTGSFIAFDNETVKTPVLMTETIDTPKDISFARQIKGNIRENNAVGFNVEFEPTDNLSFMFDYFNAEATTKEYDPRGNLNLSVGANVVKYQTMEWTDSLPIMTVGINDAVGNSNGSLDAPDMTTTAGTTNYQWVENDIEQIRLNGTFEFENSSLTAGLESRSNDYLGQNRANCCIEFGGWSGANTASVPDSFWRPRNFLSEFDGYSKGTSFTQGIDWDFEEVAQWVESQNGVLPGFGGFPPSGKFEAKPGVTTYRGILEEVQAAFVEYKLNGEFGGMPFNVLAGIRYEKTDLTSDSEVAVPERIRWTGDDDFATDTMVGPRVEVRGDTSYSHTLPSVDFDISVTDDIKARASVSKTIARPTYNNLRSDVGVSDFRSYGADRGTPGLLPIESVNYDLSVEWYYSDSSYVSLGYYRKDVDKFISTTTFPEIHYGLRDVTRGPRALAAIEQLQDLGIATPSKQQIYSQVLKNEGQIPADADINFGWNGNVLPNDDDPLAMWAVKTPVNNKSATIDGFELAVQHMFGESGFGVSANYTTVNGDITYDNNFAYAMVTNPATNEESLQKVGQFALVGMSDSANAAIFYENYGIQARLAYNWRDKFLDTANQYDNEPGYTEAFQTVDASVSYDVTDEVTVSFEALNLFGEDKRRHGRTEAQLWNLEILGPRYTLGARYTF